MRKLLFLIAAVSALAVAPPAAAKTVAVAITKAGFVPRSVTIEVGDAVTWTNSDTSPHSVVGDKGEFNSGLIQPGGTFSFTFKKAGTVRYHDGTRPREKGSVVVRAPAASVTISASLQVVLYGRATTLSGRVSSGQAGEKVVILAQECGSPTFKPVTTVDTTTGGSWTAAVKPLKNTVYQAKFQTATSESVAVTVRPRIRLGKIAPRKYSVRVSAAEDFAGKVVVFQRFNATLGVWVKVRTVVLRSTGLGIMPTVISAATFSAKIRAGLKVRIVMPLSQVGSCYLTGRSNVILS